MPRRKATSGGKTLRTRGRFSTEPSCCESANPLCKTGQVSQWMQTQVGMPHDPRVTAQGGNFDDEERGDLKWGGSAGSPQQATLVGSGESAKVAEGSALTGTIHAAAALPLTVTIHAAAEPMLSPTIHAAAQPRPSPSPPSPFPPSPFPPSPCSPGPCSPGPCPPGPGPPDRTLGATEPRMSAGLGARVGLPHGSWRSVRARLPHGSWRLVLVLQTGS